MKEKNKSSTEILSAYNKIPYALINAEVEGSAHGLLAEFGEIMKLYKGYKQGSDFRTEGSSGDYVPSDLKYKLAAQLINKEARFLFGETPDVVVKPKGDLGDVSEAEKAQITVRQSLVNTVLRRNKFDKLLIQAAKDCFIGKRIAGVVNFNEEDGISIQFLPATNFVFETSISSADTLTKFVSFTVVRDRLSLVEKRIFKKKFEMVSGICYMEEGMYDGRGALIEQVTEYQETLFDRIPAAVFINDGLIGEVSGESEIELLMDYEAWYSKLANSDIDAERKSMNPIRYTVDMDSESTKSLSSAAGSFWDLGSDQNLDKPAPSVGLIESSMSYTEALKTTLDRIKATMYEAIDMPNISLETMQATITSGKALKAIYWPLMVRCKEKMKVWGPQLEYLTRCIIDGSILYPEAAASYTQDKLTEVEYEVNVLVNYPLPEDELEEKQQDLSEVTGQTLSKKSYMKKWHKLTDQEADEELAQIALERQLLEDSFAEADPADNMNEEETDEEE